MLSEDHLGLDGLSRSRGTRSGVTVAPSGFAGTSVQGREVIARD